jgi:hypothetical protein
VVPCGPPGAPWRAAAPCGKVPSLLAFGSVGRASRRLARDLARRTAGRRCCRRGWRKALGGRRRTFVAVYGDWPALLVFFEVLDAGDSLIRADKQEERGRGDLKCKLSD